jgi:phosphopantetheinyl transferase (holo-ACP synthase)
MIGNDIVDLRDDDVRLTERTPAFDSRVFTAGERERIVASPDGIRTRWLMWSAKEAAYKLARKRDRRVRFVPSRFEVDPWAASDVRASFAGENAAQLRGRVHLGEFSMDCEWISAQGFVHALCRMPGQPGSVSMAIERVEALEDRRADPGEAVRRLAIGEIARTLGSGERDLQIRKEDRIPVLYLDDHKLPADLSLSHHGRLVAFACRLSLDLAKPGRREGTFLYPARLAAERAQP